MASQKKQTIRQSHLGSEQIITSVLLILEWISNTSQKRKPPSSPSCSYSLLSFLLLLGKEDFVYSAEKTKSKELLFEILEGFFFSLLMSLKLRICYVNLSCQLYIMLVHVLCFFNQPYSCDVGKGRTTISMSQIFQKVAHKKALVFLVILHFTYLCPKSS